MKTVPSFINKERNKEVEARLRKKVDNFNEEDILPFELQISFDFTVYEERENDHVITLTYISKYTRMETSRCYNMISGYNALMWIESLIEILKEI